MKKTIELDRKTIINLLRGVTPPYEIMRKIPEDLGYYIGGFDDKWTWSIDNSEYGDWHSDKMIAKYSDEYLYDLYLMCIGEKSDYEKEIPATKDEAAEEIKLDRETIITLLGKTTPGVEYMDLISPELGCCTDGLDFNWVWHVANGEYSKWHTDEMKAKYPDEYLYELYLKFGGTEADYREAYAKKNMPNEYEGMTLDEAVAHDINKAILKELFKLGEENNEKVI